MDAMNVTRREFAEMRVWSVGQVEMGPLVEVGVYPYLLIPLETKSAPKAETS